MVQFVHPAADDISIDGILSALSDPMRRKIFKALMEIEGCSSCTDAAPCPKMAKSTLSNHFRILREAGLIRTTKQGVENRNIVRTTEVNEKFPGLLKTILKFEE